MLDLRGCVARIVIPCLLRTLVLAVLTQGVAFAQSLEQTLSDIKQHAQTSLRFTEIRKSELFSAPLQYEGELHFDSQTQELKKIITKPVKATLTIDKHKLIMQRAGKKRRELPLSKRPQLRTLHLGLSSLLTGAPHELQRAFTVAYTTDTKKQWRIVLTPRDKALRRDVIDITLTGSGHLVTTMVIELAKGESQETRFIHGSK